MASRAWPDSFAAHYEALSTKPPASFMCSSAAARQPVTPPAGAIAAAAPAVGGLPPEVLLNPYVTRGVAAPSFVSYPRLVGTQYSLPSSASSLPAEGPPPTAPWQPFIPAGASLTVPPPLGPGLSYYQQTSAARPATVHVCDGSRLVPADYYVPSTRTVAPPRLLPPLSSSGDWLGRGRFSSAAFTAEDMPGFSTLRRGIVLCIMLLLISSLFACIGRADFNFVLYLLGYHLWCVESDTKTVTGVKRLIRGARQYAILLCIAAVVDTTWLFIAYSTWSCEKGDPELCFPEPENLRVRWAYGIHNWALGLSTFNLLLKARRWALEEAVRCQVAPQFFRRLLSTKALVWHLRVYGDALYGSYVCSQRVRTSRRRKRFYVIQQYKICLS
ncbi:unnamed protein product, partial [Rangifer tarandus platyrhynchus]